MLTTQSRVGTQVGRQAGKSRTDLKDLNPLSGFGMALLAPHIHIVALCTKVMQTGCGFGRALYKLCIADSTQQEHAPSHRVRTPQCHSEVFVLNRDAAKHVDGQKEIRQLHEWHMQHEPLTIEFVVHTGQHVRRTLRFVTP